MGMYVGVGRRRRAMVALDVALVVVGGESVFSAQVLTALWRVGELDRVDRVTGATCVDTAAEEARRILAVSEREPGDTKVIVANGWSLPDTDVAAVSSARTENSVVLCTEAGRHSPEAAAALRDYQPARIVSIGGPAAFKPDIKIQARAVVPDATAPRRRGPIRTQAAAFVESRACGSWSEASGALVGCDARGFGGQRWYRS